VPPDGCSRGRALRRRHRARPTPLQCEQHFFRCLETLFRIAGHGAIVNVIGASGDRPRADYLSGSMANAALIAMSRALGAEGPDHGVRVVGLSPASTATERQTVRWKERAQKQLGDTERWRELTKGFPFGRLATVDEIASAIVFLASGRASYVSGTVLTVDGGRSSRSK